MKSDYKSSGFDRVMCMLLMWISIVPVMLLVCSTAYPLFNDMPQMTTIVVSTKRCFWMCVVSLLSSATILTMYVTASFKVSDKALLEVNPDQVDDAGFEIEVK